MSIIRYLLLPIEKKSITSVDYYIDIDATRHICTEEKYDRKTHNFVTHNRLTRVFNNIIIYYVGIVFQSAYGYYLLCRFKEGIVGNGFVLMESSSTQTIETEERFASIINMYLPTYLYNNLEFFDNLSYKNTFCATITRVFIKATRYIYVIRILCNMHADLLHYLIF